MGSIANGTKELRLELDATGAGSPVPAIEMSCRNGDRSWPVEIGMYTHRIVNWRDGHDVDVSSWVSVRNGVK